MSREVPRRESPWGVSGGPHREPKAHRCNDRAEDVIHACFEGNPFKTVPGPIKLFWRCMRSKPGLIPLREKSQSLSEGDCCRLHK
ncbi:uncharacterized protein LOC105420716 isoform X3 [Amborella trichopoda]|uniref:uncharacterized protein LOC105420716 isoform X3 n=1 Tax=Amborella trichopoda TaxID=13333 RepID=UPI0009C1884F|nr:uncharacterized protein LOC105420716 isoform X3 [Amborella trichopoda]|eukprot:XP_020523336.1 uncharacterized protein LOC105420716 isoform X3 [Amborella trichopoda]